MTAAYQPATYGYNNTCSGYNTSVFGNNNTVAGNYGTACGYNNSISDTWTIVVGQKNNASNEGACAIGYQNTASGQYSLAIGYKNTASGQYSIAIGNTYSIYGSYSIPTVASGNVSVAIGNNCTAASLYSVTIGNWNTTFGAYNNPSPSGGEFSAPGAVAVGFGNNMFLGGATYSFYRGWMGGGPPMIAPIVGAQSTAVGVFNTAASYYGVSVGSFNLAGLINDPPTWISLAFGYKNTSSDNGTTACGYQNLASGEYSSAFGYKNTASNQYTCAVGTKCSASGNYSSAFGYNSSTSGNYSLVIGNDGIANGTFSSAIGYGAEARIDSTTNIAGSIIIRKDNGESLGTEFLYFAGTDNIIFSKVIDLTSSSTSATIDLPSGCTFSVEEVGIVVTTVTGFSVGPIVNFGDENGSGDLVLLSTSSNLDAVGNTVKWRSFGVVNGGSSTLTTPGSPGSLLNENFHTQLTANVATGATATTLTGRFYWKGILLENQ